jgi:peptidoglycan/LPS O-acetylase OafA/YrhL
VGKRFYPELESLRGVAALMVALFHICQTPAGDRNLIAVAIEDSSAVALLLRVVGNGYGAVIFFFVLSGFVLPHQLDRMPGSWLERSGNFLIGRAFRIMPGVAVMVAIFTAAYFATGLGLSTRPETYEPINILKNALLLNNHINGVTWTLQLEMLAAPIILVLFIAARRWGNAPLIAAFIVFAALSFTGTWTKALTPYNLLGPSFAFVAGMLAWRMPFPGKKPIACLALSVIGFAAARPVLGWGSNWAVLTESVCAALVISSLVASKGNWLNVRPLRFYGRISYSFYLLHPLTLFVIWNEPERMTSAIAIGIPAPAMILGLFIASVLVATPLAHLQFHLVERRGMSANRVKVATAERS